MAGSLAHHLQNALAAAPPRGWRTIGTEQRVLPPDLANAIGTNPAADLAIERVDTGQRLWLELEISRADPVANHAKFAVAHLAQGARRSEPPDIFVSLMSPHVTAGRRRLAAHAVTMMRRLDMLAFQTVLFPQLDGARIKALNHMGPAQLSEACPPVAPEWRRVLQVCEPVRRDDGHDILFVGDPAEVRWNIFAWNREVGTPTGAALWGGARGFRVVQHFVWAPSLALFAPTKFCAFVPPGGALGMNLGLYAALDESESRFDGRVAWKHLERIGFTRADDADAQRAFAGWLADRHPLLRVRGSQPVLWRPPSWAI